VRRADGLGRVMRRALAALALGLAVALAAGAALVVHRSRSAPERALADPPPWPSTLGPPPSALAAAAERRMDQALAALADRDRPGPERLAAYRDQLAAAERLLVASLAARAEQPRMLVRLAAVRAELGLPGDLPRAVPPEIEGATRLAPGSASVHHDAGAVLLSLGRREDGVRLLARAAALDPGESARVAATLHEHGFDTDAILDAVADRRAALVALTRSAGTAALLDRLEPELAGGGAETIAAFAALALRLGQAERLAAALAGIRTRDEHAEIERLLQLARAQRIARRADQALATIAGALGLAPDDPRCVEEQGWIALDAQDHGTSAAAFRRGLELVATRTVPAETRGRLYAGLGLALEAGAEPGRAYDAYRHALRHVPEQPIARERLARLESAAGTRRPALP
jgi:tetratricopeptide (TPR) repeat protein